MNKMINGMFIGQNSAKESGTTFEQYLGFAFAESTESIIETLREDPQLDDVHYDELRTVVNAQVNR